MPETRVSRRHLFKTAGIAGAVGVAALAPGAIVASAAESSEDSLIGAWRGTVNPVGAPSFELLTSFAAGGSLVTSASIDLTKSNLSTPAFGAWARTHPGRYAVKFQFFNFDAQANPSGSGELKADVKVDGDNLRGPFTLRIFNSAGLVVFKGGGTIESKRIEAN
jgi:hypothetical protein